MQNQPGLNVSKSPCSCCLDAHDFAEAVSGVTRREFLAAAGVAAIAGSVLTAGMARASLIAPDHRKPTPKPLRVQPVFNCEIYARKPATSWRVTGAIQNQGELREEENRIQHDLEQLAKEAGFPLEVRPLVTVQTVEQATAAAKGEFDVMLIYAARRNVPVLEALANHSHWNLMFVRHRSGPLYYMYIGAHTHFLRKRRDAFGQSNMDVHDIVVDQLPELQWRLRSLYALNNLRGKRIVAIGGAGGWGADGGTAPERAQKTWNLDIRTVKYEELSARLIGARAQEARLTGRIVNLAQST
jgi:hypothetical protein